MQKSFFRADFYDLKYFFFIRERPVSAKHQQVRPILYDLNLYQQILTYVEPNVFIIGNLLQHFKQ